MEGLIDYVQQHQGQFWVLAGFVMLAIEAFVLGMGTGILLFVGLGAIATGLLMQTGLIPETWTSGISGVGIASAIITGILWKPFKRIQGSQENPRKEVSNDMVGLRILLTRNLSHTQPVEHQYSGISWKLQIDPEANIDSIPSGTEVEVTATSVGVMRVRPCS
ncbi:MAG: activity regulator of membrane protease YbbK [Gammaproteobacteria bacterium]|nr:activity regulator of membrane protease YbbK [Gammaproteobacteria bacterium]